MFKIKFKISKPIHAVDKQAKLAATERYLAARRKVARADTPLSFRSRTSSGYYSLYSQKF